MLLRMMPCCGRGAMFMHKQEEEELQWFDWGSQVHYKEQNWCKQRGLVSLVKVLGNKRWEIVGNLRSDILFHVKPHG